MPLKWSRAMNQAYCNYIIKGYDNTKILFHIAKI